MPMTARMPSPCSSDRPHSWDLASEDLKIAIDLTFLGGALAAGQPFADSHHEQGADDLNPQFNRLRDHAELIFHKGVGHQHAAGDPAQQGATEGDHDGEAID